MTPQPRSTADIYSPEPTRAKFVDLHDEVGDQCRLAAVSIWEALFCVMERAKNELARNRYAGELSWALFGVQMMVLRGSADWHFLEFLSATAWECEGID